MRRIFLSLLILLLSGSIFTINGQTVNTKQILILVEGKYDLSSKPTAFGRELTQLLGHFKTTVNIEGVNSYKSNEINKYDFIFYIGSSKSNRVPHLFSKDILATKKSIIWINTGFEEFSKNADVVKRYGFVVTSQEEKTEFTNINSGNEIFTRGAKSINLVRIVGNNKVSVWAKAVSSKNPSISTPYMLKSDNLIYVADIPFIGTDQSDSYLYFADKLHDILGENHPVSHKCTIRIEDVSATSNPNKLRDIADYLSGQGIPFLVGVVPIYVNPSDGTYIKLSDRPEVVDALKYMVKNGASIVMHGTTHQYKGVSTLDAEFWNMTTNTPVEGENIADFSKKIELGLNEFFKNGLFPIAWETPHYMGTVVAYTAISKYFSTVVEQRMAIDDFDYGQYFPYIIEKDIYGQKIYPENLGYIPLDPSPDSTLASANYIINRAKIFTKVRDGFVSCFFHPFMDISLLEALVNGLKKEGFAFVDLKDDNNSVKMQDKVIFTGEGDKSYMLSLNDTYLCERYFNDKSEVNKRLETKQRINGSINKKVALSKGHMYVAESVDFHIKIPTFFDKLIQKYKTYISERKSNENWKEATVGVCWNPSARGAAYYDQASLISIFKSLNINVDTLFIGDQDIRLKNVNLLVVPFSAVDSLSYFEKQNILHFVEEGGNLITDGKNKLIETFDFNFSSKEVPIHQIRDNYFPQEIIYWSERINAPKFETTDNDLVFSEDAATGLPLVVGRDFGKGKILYFSTLFDPKSSLGYSHFPFAFEYIKRYLQLQPVVKRENLEVYFDPGFRTNVSIENLIKLWSKTGIRIIHIAGWHQYPKYEYDYKKVISLAHANGILVYAWLEPPQVSQMFWDSHPEWREKNYLGKDARASWRYPVALTDEKCLEAVIQQYMRILKAFDWDGVNLAELYFEAGQGFAEPEKFTPMHSSALSEFHRKYGFDMKKVFDKHSPYYWELNPNAKADVINFRVNKIAEITDKVVGSLYEYSKEKNGFGIIVTFMDTYFSPEITTYHGVSSDKMIDLQKKYHIYLQPEDPQTKWSTDPNRYDEFGKFYAKKMADPSKLLVDLNILTIRDKAKVSNFPTLIQTGIECFQMVNSASTGAPRFTIYSEATFNPQDLYYLSYASSGPVKYQATKSGYTVSSPVSFELRLPKNIKAIKVDGQEVLGYSDNTFVIPAGEHMIGTLDNESQFSTIELQPQLLTFTGNLLAIKYEMRQITFEYDSYERAYASFNLKPTSVKLDGVEYKFEVLSGNDCFTLMLPCGKHKVEVVTGDEMTYNINLTSLWSISAIALYGFFAVSLLFIMYLILKILRKRLEK